MTPVLPAFSALYARCYVTVGSVRLAVVHASAQPCIACGKDTPDHVVNGEQLAPLHVACAPLV